MIKRLAAMVFTTFILAGASWANNTGLYGSYWDSDDLDEGIGGGAKVTFDVTNVLALDLRASYINFDELEMNVVPLEGSLQIGIPFGEAISPYGGIGMGYYFFDADEADVDDEVGFFALGGLELHLREGVSLFGEIRYFVLEADVKDALDEVEDLDDELSFDGYGVNFGLSLDW